MPSLLPEKVRWCLKQVHSGIIFDINETDNYMVGRNETAHIILDSRKTSRRHSSFVVNIEGHLLVQDLKSANGTYVNDANIPELVLQRVFPEDLISFGVPSVGSAENDKDLNAFFVVCYKEPPVQADFPSDILENQSLNGVRSSAGNSTIEIGMNSSSEPSSSRVKNETIEVIESDSDEERPDDDDLFEENANRGQLKIAEVASKPEKSKMKSNNWLQKPSLSNKLTITKSSVKPMGNKKIMSCKQSAANFSNLRKEEKKEAIPNVLEENSCDNPKIKKGLTNEKAVKETKSKELNDKQALNILNTFFNVNKDKAKKSPNILAKQKRIAIPESKVEGCSSGRRSVTGDSSNRTKDQASGENKAEKNGGSAARAPSRIDCMSSNDSDQNKNTNVKNSKRKEGESDDDLLLQLDTAISTIKPNYTIAERESGDSTSEKNKISSIKKRELEKDRALKSQPSNLHKRVQIENGAEFSFSRHLSTPKDDVLGVLIDHPSRSSKVLDDPRKLFVNERSSQINHKNRDSTEESEENNNYKNQNKHVKDLDCTCFEPGSSRAKIKCLIHNVNLGANANHKITSTPNRRGNEENDSNLKNISSINIKSPDNNNFTTDKDNSVIIIDITDDDDDMDFSCSQIFHMSQVVKLEEQDDTFQKIKNELAEMEFCEDGTIVNPIPINLDDDLEGFENTQDICACLEDTVKKNNVDNISLKERYELLKDLGEDQDVVSMKVPLDTSLSKESSRKDIDSINFYGKTKYVKPPVVEPHAIIKLKKDLPKKSPSKQDAYDKEENQSTKRKNSLEAPAKKKKLKGSPRIVAEPPRCDAKSIRMEFKKRHSGSKLNHDDKLHKSNIREERRKKLKEISERTPPEKETKVRADKGKTVKVLPESKTRRGTFLCEDPKKDGALVRKLSKNEKSTKENKDIRKESKYKDVNSVCQCNQPGVSDHPIECQVHAINPNNKDKHFKTPAPKQTIPNKQSIDYNLKPTDMQELSLKYNLRRTKSSGDIKADMIKSNEQSLPVQSRYNLRYSSALEDNRNVITHDPLHKGGVPTWYPVSASLGAPYVNHHAPQYHQNAIQPAVYTTDSRNDLARRLMWTNGGERIRRAPVRRLAAVDEFVQKMVNWLPNWLTEQVNIDYSAPVNSPPARKIPLSFNSFDQYEDIFSKLVLLENWQYLFKGFREGSEQPRKVKIEHVRVANDITTMDCTTYITQKELRQGFFYKPEDFVLLECVVNDQNNSYISVNFGFIQRSKKSIISNNDVISIRCNCCQGEPHTKLEFTLVTRHQPDKEITTKKFPIVKVLANIRAHLMMIRAIKMLVDSPLCSKILRPKINEYKFGATHCDIIQPHSLNTQQRSIVLEAASLCTGKDPGIYCIKGPPGTGKSTVIVHLVFQILFSYYVTKKTKQPPMILLAAPSNTAVDNLLYKLIDFKHSLPSAWDKYKSDIKCVRIGPESSISKDLSGYSLSKLADKHLPVKYAETPEFRAAFSRNENLLEFSRTFFGDRYGYELKACEDLIIEKSNIICTTLNSCINGKLIEAVNRGLIKFSCCIIDEATQCHEVEALLPTILGIDKFVLVGDPKQLNATIMNRDAYKLGFGESLFSRISNNFVSDPRTPIRMLTEQYRMHPEICAFPNNRFYEGKLRSLPNHLNKLPEKIRPYLVFNCDKINDSGDYTNIDEVNLIKKLLSTIFEMFNRKQKFTIGIITPYNAQKDLINYNIMELVQKNNHKVAVNTVDSFQGSENDIIIISCVRESANSFLQNENRLNVALTRAKQALYVVGNYALFKECRALYDLREDAKKRKLLLDIRQDPMTINNFSRYLIQKD